MHRRYTGRRGDKGVWGDRKTQLLIVTEQEMRALRLRQQGSVKRTCQRTNRHLGASTKSQVRALVLLEKNSSGSRATQFAAFRRLTQNYAPILQG